MELKRIAGIAHQRGPNVWSEGLLAAANEAKVMSGRRRGVSALNSLCFHTVSRLSGIAFALAFPRFLHMV